MQARRVVVVTHTAELGGAELALLRLIDAIDRSAWEVSVVTLASGPLHDRLRAAGVSVELIDDPALARVGRDATSRAVTTLRHAPRALRAVTLLRASLRRHHPDLVVAHSLKAAMLVPAALAATRVRWVWHLHDRLATDYMPSPAVAALRLIASWSPRAVVANSMATLATLPRRARRRASVAYPGVDPSLGLVQRRLPSTPVVGLVGRIGPTKGQREFVDAARMVARSHPEARFAVIGAAMFADHAYEETVRAHAGDSVEWRGWSDDPVAAIAGLTVLAHASPVPEPFGQVVAEAVCLGVAVVATEAGGIPEIVAPHGTTVDPSTGLHQGDYGLLVPPGDVEALAAAIGRLLEDPHAELPRDNARAAAVDALSIARTAAQVHAVWLAASRR